MADVVDAQPDASSVSETVAEVPKVDEAPAQAEPEREQMIPRPRFDERTSQWRAEQEARHQAEQRAVAAETRANELARYLNGEAQPEEDVGAKVARQLQPALANIQAQVFALKDERDRSEFWRTRSAIAEDIQADVEAKLAGFRSQGLTAIRREDLLAYEIGQRQLPTLLKAQSQARQTPAANKVAHAEAGNTASKPAPKSVDDMTPAEIRALYGDQVF